MRPPPTLCFVISLVCITQTGNHAQAPPSPVFINELHYDNAGTDTAEFIEIAGPAGTNLAGYSLVLYNGANGQSYDTDALSGMIPDQQGGFGTVAVSYPTDGIQNGSPDAVALVQGTTVVQFLSYEGVFTAVNGPASGLTSTDIGVSEVGTTSVGFSLQLQGTGTTYSQFTWATPAAHTAGTVNTGQAFGGGEPSISINDVSVSEGNAGTVNAVFTVTVSGSHGDVGFDIATADGSGTSPAMVVDGDYVARSELAQIIPSTTSTFSFAVAITGDATFEPDEQFSVLLTNVTGAAVGDAEGTGTIVNDDVPPPVTSDVVISQVYGGGGNSGAAFTHDFIELFNRGASSVNLTGWSVQYASSAGSLWSATALSGSIPPGGYYLVRQAAGAGGTTPLPAPDAAGNIAMAAGSGKVVLSSTSTAFTVGCPSSDSVQDLIGYGAANCFEGTGPAPGIGNTTSAQRKRGGCFDSNDNATDFGQTGPMPRNSAAPQRSCTVTPAPIHEIQGSAAVTPYLGQDVLTTGVVTGRKVNGFFIQTAGDSDGNPATSQGLFVFTSATPAVAVGDLVTARGTASEFFGLTQIEGSLPGDVVVESSGGGVPAAVALTPSLLDPAGPPDQLEHLEGMRVHADALISVAPTSEFGEFLAVLTGVPRPLREPGIEIVLPIPPDPTSGAVDCCIPRFDRNPERIGVDSDGLAGVPPVSITSNVTVTGVTGPLDFAFGFYRVLPETALVPSPGMSAVPVRPRAADEFTIAGFNVENFSGHETQRKKAALAIRQVLRFPDVIGLIEIRDQASLEALAQQVNQDAALAGDAGIDYVARLIPAPNPSNTQNVGFLVNADRVQIDSVTQERATATFINPSTGLEEALHDRPPLVLRATVAVAGRRPRPIVVIVNHLRSFIGIELVGSEGPRVRAKRKAQAEDLAALLQTLQTSDPATPVVSIGDYNAYQFNDGYTDPIATIKGTPTPDDQLVVDESPVLVNPGFINLTDLLPAGERYTFVFEGTPQALDHVLVNTTAAGIVRDYVIARNNADFPEGPTFAGDATRPERNSDHDMPVAYFAFAPEADLALTVTGPSAPIETGSSFSYSFMVANNGPETASNVVLSVAALSALRFSSLEAAAGWTCLTPLPGLTGAISCSVPALAAQASAIFTVTAAVDCAVPDGAALGQAMAVTSVTADFDVSNNQATVGVAASNPAPVISGTTASLLAVPAPGAPRAGAVVSDAALGSPVAADNCPAPSLVRTGVPPGNLFPVGQTTVTYAATDSGGAVATTSTLVHVLGARESLPAVAAQLESILLANPRPALRTRIDKAWRDVRSAIAELDRLNSRHSAAVAFLSSATGELEEILRRGLLDAATTRDLLQRITGASWTIAKQDVEAAVGSRPPLVIALASILISQGDAAYAAGRYELASGFYGAATWIVAVGFGQ